MAETVSGEVCTLPSIVLPPLPRRRVVVGCGMASIDFVSTVDAFPKPDEKIKSKRLKVLGGGNAGNTLTCAARLGLTPRLISKVADDTHGGYILAELEADGIDISNVVISKGGTSTFSHVIVDSQTKTRTCIYTPVYPAMVPEDLPRSNLISGLDEAKLVYFDGWLHRTALVVAQQAAEMNIPILVGAERNKSGLNGLLDLASYIICSEKFPQEWTSIPSITYALVSILLRLPHVRFVIVTLGEKGCIMLERSIDGQGSEIDETDAENLLESLKMRVDKDNVLPSCVSSERCVQRCLHRKCCLLLLKWLLSAVEHLVLGLVYLDGWILAWLHSYIRLLLLQEVRCCEILAWITLITTITLRQAACIKNAENSFVALNYDTPAVEWKSMDR